MRKSILNARLLSAADFVRQGALFADIGTDHAYLPLFLLDEGRISRAVCADVNRGPLDSARKNAELRGHLDSVDFVLTDGAAALADMGVTDYAICGMGGELIADIISAAPHLRSEKINLILQPMTKQAYLRKFLLSEGFRITAERYSYDAGRYYVCMRVAYHGIPLPLSDEDAEIGLREFSDVDRAAHIGYLRSRLAPLAKAARGKELCGQFPTERVTAAIIADMLGDEGVTVDRDEYLFS